MKKAKRFDDITTAALMCRSFGHAWKVDLITRGRVGGAGVWRVSLVCLRCKTGRDDVIPLGVNPETPYSMHRSYSYTDGYQVADRKSWGGAGLLRRSARDVLFRRLKEGTR